MSGGRKRCSARGYGGVAGGFTVRDYLIGRRMDGPGFPGAGRTQQGSSFAKGSLVAGRWAGQTLGRAGWARTRTSLSQTRIGKNVDTSDKTDGVGSYH